MKITLNTSRAMRQGGFAGISLATVATVAGIAAAGTSIAAATGAFAPSAPGGGTVNTGQTVSDAIQAANNQINALTTQVNADNSAIATLQAQEAKQTQLEYISLGLAVVSAGAGLILFFRRKR